jgi:alpha-beta hydrolase superfamily lysophospholipase
MAVPTFPSAAEARHEEGFLNSRDHLRLYWQRYLPPDSRATVVVLHGGGDHCGRYPALTSALVAAGFEVALVDLRGHGQSDGRRWYVDAFADYLMDLDVFMERTCQSAAGRPVFVVAHSMGGLIAALWGLTPGRAVRGFVFSSPYLEHASRLPVIKVLAARLASGLVPFLPLATGIRSSDLTADPEMQTWTDRDPLYGRATTPRWFVEAIRAQERVRRGAGRWSYPLLVLVGTADRIADHRTAGEFLRATGSADADLLVYQGFGHELFNEVGRQRPIADTVAWISHRCGGQKR